MATPTPARRNALGAIKDSSWLYFAYVLLVTALTIVLMVVPAQEINEGAADAKLQLDTTFGDLDGKGWLSLALIFIGFIVMVFDWVGADLVMNAILALMVTFKILTVKAALIGFGNSGLMTVVILFIVAQGITSTGGADWLITKLLGTPSDTMLAQVRMCLITILFSSFVNDTPVFCIMLPIVLTWAAKSRLPIKQLIIPLSYCALLGGMNTTIGTSTNLVVTGQWVTRVLDPKSPYYQEGVTPIKLFGVTPYGLPQCIWGTIYIILAAPFLLNSGAGKKVFQKYKSLVKKEGENPNEGAFEQGADFFFGLLVSSNSPAIGKSLEDANLRHLSGGYITSIKRGNKIIHAVSSDFVLSAGDVLYLSGVPDGLQKLAADHGLVPYSDSVEHLSADEIPGLSATFGVDSISVPKIGNGSDDGSTSAFELVSALLVKGSEIDGKSIREAAFRSRYHAAVVAIKRNGIPLQWSGSAIGDEILKAGDELLLDVNPQFWTSVEVNAAFEDIRKGGQIKSHSEFVLPMTVTKFLNGSSIQKAGLRQLPNAFLIAIERRGKTLHAVSPDELLETDDIAWFATGSVEAVRFIRNTPGLTTLGDKHAEQLKSVPRVERRLVQAIISNDSPLIGSTARDIKFREQFNAAIVAVARQGERVRANPGVIPLKSGDILLVDAGPSFYNQYKDSKYFSLILEVENTNPPRYFHTGICFALVATAFILYGLEELDILIGASLTAMALLLTGCLSGDQARRAIRWDVYLMIAGSFGVSAGLEQSGGAAAIANAIVSIGKNAGGDGFVIAAIYIAATLLSQIISNNSAAALLFPIAATISKNDGIDIYILSYAVMLGASSVFMSSFGYQTNLMALAAGGHSSRDFLKFGTPMQIVLGVVAIASLLLGLDDNWKIMWIITAIAGAIILSAPQVVALIRAFQNRGNKQ